MGIQSRPRIQTFAPLRALRYATFIIASTVERPVVVGLYLVMVAAGFVFLVGIVDRFGLGTEGGSVWPELHNAAAIVPGGLFLLPLLAIVLTLALIKALDRLIDALDPA